MLDNDQVCILPKAVQQLKNVCSWEQSEIEVDVSCSLSHIHIHTRRAVLSNMAVHKKAKQWRFVLRAGPTMTQTSNSTAHSPAVISRKSVQFNWSLHILFKPGLPEFHKYLEMHVTARHCPIWNLTVLKNNNSPDTNIFMQKAKQNKTMFPGFLDLEQVSFRELYIVHNNPRMGKVYYHCTDKLRIRKVIRAVL